ncbi:hypothetical protein AMTRI_Chr08g160230 [Amborella trichopoda]
MAATPGDSFDSSLYPRALFSLYLICPLTVLPLQLLQAPYGKHSRNGWGPSLSPPLAWFLMESPTLWLTLILLPQGRHFHNPQTLALLSPFLFHYLHRTCIFPLRLLHRQKTVISGQKSPGFPFIIALMAFVFNLFNTYLQARWVSHYSDYGPNWCIGLRFNGGLLVFITGLVINIWADSKLIALKGEGGGYKIPRGGLFEVISCPNYFGEALEWLGWAILTWSWAGLGFFLYTMANLGPRARAHHDWYLKKFADDYPKSRKAMIPFVY